MLVFLALEILVFTDLLKHFSSWCYSLMIHQIKIAID